MNEQEMGSDEEVDQSYTMNQLRVSEMLGDTNNGQHNRSVRKMATNDLELRGKEWM